MIWRVGERDILQQLARGRRRRRGPVSMVRLRLPGAEARAEPARVAYRVSRRTGNAVTRNRVRRRLRSAVERHAAMFTPGSAYLVTAETGAAQAPFTDLEEAVGALVRHLADGGEVVA